MQRKSLLGLLVALRVLLALLIMQNVLPMPPDMRLGWYLHHGGDQHLMFRLAQGLVEGQPTREVTGLGTSLVMALFIWLFDTSDYFGIVMPMVLVNGFLLGGLSVAMLFTLTRHVTHNQRIAAISALIWAIAPLLSYLLFMTSPIWLGFYVPKIGWLNGLSDPPAAFFFLLSVMLLARQQELPVSCPRWLAIGLSLGMMVIFRIHFLFAVAFLIGYAVVAHGKRAGLWIGLGALIAYLPQAIYNVMVYDLPFTTGYIAYSIAETDPAAAVHSLNLPFHPQYLIAFVTAHLPISIALTAAAAIATVTLWKRHGWQCAALMIGAPLSYLLPMVSAWPFAYDPVRFTLPVIPFIAAIGLLALRSLLLVPASWVRPQPTVPRSVPANTSHEAPPPLQSTALDRAPQESG